MTRIITTLVVIAVGSVLTPSAAAGTRASRSSAIATHDNVRAAGVLHEGVLRVQLRAGVGTWAPDGRGGGTLEVEAFGEGDGPLQIPGPLLRVPQGTKVRASLKNDLPHRMTVHGLCDRPGKCLGVELAAGERREVEFTLGSAGTFHYWATTTDSAINERRARDSQLGGAIVVDAPGADAKDRIFVMTIWEETRPAGTTGPVRDVLAINGRSWPHTERLKQQVGDDVRWRVVNLSGRGHPMHLHGFHFHVESVGNGTLDTTYSGEKRRLVVTENMPAGGTMSMSWTPTRAGNWLFHCHILLHMMPLEGVGSAAHDHHGSAGMRGLVLGIEVSGPDTGTPASVPATRTFRLTANSDARHAPAAGYRFTLEEQGGGIPPIVEGSTAGPPLIVYRGESVAVEIVNNLAEPTAVHWHGIELESFDDGVPEFGKTGASVTPPVAPGGRFTARFTPVRAGTFMYHTHWHNAEQLFSGLYGPLIVLEPGQRFDPETDHLLLLALDGPDNGVATERFTINGRHSPQPLELKAGVAHRIRMINITPNNAGLNVQLLSNLDLATWRVVAKDAVDLPASQIAEAPSRQRIAVGETYDVMLAPMRPRPQGLWLELRRGNGELLKQWPVVVK
jgi:manganese oxidase